MNPGGGQTLRLDIFLTHDDVRTGSAAHGFSLNFDTDLLNELNLGRDGAGRVGRYGPRPGRRGQPATPRSTPAASADPESTGASVGSHQLVRERQHYAGPAGERRRVHGRYVHGDGTGQLPSRAGVLQSRTARSQMARTSSAVCSTAASTASSTAPVRHVPGGQLSFGTATVNVIPEPGTVSLLGLGLVGLVLAGRRSRRS